MSNLLPHRSLGASPFRHPNAGGNADSSSKREEAEEQYRRDRADTRKRYPRPGSPCEGAYATKARKGGGTLRLRLLLSILLSTADCSEVEPPRPTGHVSASAGGLLGKGHASTVQAGQKQRKPL